VSTSGPQPGGMPDPMQFWREMYQQSESAWSKVFEQNLGSEAFASSIGQTLDAYVSFQKALKDSLNRYLETMNLPSRDDFARLGSMVVALESKIDRLDQKVDELLDRGDGSAPVLEELRAILHEHEERLTDLNETLTERDQKVEAMLNRFVAPQRRANSRPSRSKEGS
jgi:polyhydroxyalkanoic acid synthase PhaR subunit